MYINIKHSDSLKLKANQMIGHLSYDNNQLMLKDIGNMINEYLGEAEAAIVSKRGRDINECNIKYKRAKEISGYIDYYINQLNLNQFHDNTQRYFYMSQKLKLLQVLNVIIIVITFLLNIFLVLWFTNKISVPIVSHSKSADEISRGNFNVEDVKVNADDEIKIMAVAFNKMKDNIKNHIDELKSQAEMETKLMEEKMQNLKMKNLLKNAQIQALQYQINPHFLFNTLE